MVYVRVGLSFDTSHHSLFSQKLVYLLNSTTTVCKLVQLNFALCSINTHQFFAFSLHCEAYLLPDE